MTIVSILHCFVVKSINISYICNIFHYDITPFRSERFIRKTKMWVWQKQNVLFNLIKTRMYYFLKNWNTEDIPTKSLIWTWRFKITPFSPWWEQHNLKVMSGKILANYLKYLLSNTRNNIEILCWYLERSVLLQGERVPH